MLRSLAFAVGICSSVSLAWKGLDLSFGPLLLRVLETYEQGMSTFFYVVEPYLHELVHLMGSYFQIDLQLGSHWKHIFVLMGIYFFRNAYIAYRVGQIGTAAFDYFFGALVALLASVCVGVLPLLQGDVWANYLFAVIPIVGVAFYDIGDTAWAATWHRSRDAMVEHRAVQSWWRYFVTQSYFDLRRAIAGLLGVTLGLQIPQIRALQSPGLAILALLVIALAFWWLYTGFHRASVIRESDEPWFEAFWRTSGTRLGMAMLYVIAGAVGTLLLNAILAQFGL